MFSVVLYCRLVAFHSSLDHCLGRSHSKVLKKLIRWGKGNRSVGNWNMLEKVLETLWQKFMSVCFGKFASLERIYRSWVFKIILWWTFPVWLCCGDSKVSCVRIMSTNSLLGNNGEVTFIILTCNDNNVSNCLRLPNIKTPIS